MALTYVDIELVRLRTGLANLERKLAAGVSVVVDGGSGGTGGDPSGGVSGFSVDANGDLILTYAGAPADVAIDGDGNLILEV